MVSKEFQVGDLVWAKMKNYPPWPARIEEPKPGIKAPKNKKAHFVFFFGTENFAWILDENISPHSETLLNGALGKKKSAAYRDAIDALVDYSGKEKQGSPAKIKKKKTEIKDSQTKVVKVVNSVSKKKKRKVLTHKSSLKSSKRSYLDTDEDSGTYSNSKRDNPYEYSSSNDCDNDYPALNQMKSLINQFPRWDDDPQEEIFDQFLNRPNETLDKKHVDASECKFGFIGLGSMGSAIVMNLLQSKHDVTVWNRNAYKCLPLVQHGAKQVSTPAELMISCDVTFCCVTDDEASKALIFGGRGILKGLEEASSLGLPRRGYVELTSMDPDNAIEINEAIAMKDCLYLEAPLFGTSQDAQDGTLLIIASGDRRLFSQCESCFHAIGKHAFYLTCDVGYSSKVKLFLSTFSGVMCVALAEAMVLAERLNISKESFIDLLQVSPLSTDNILQKIQMMRQEDTTTFMSLETMLNDINYALQLSDKHSQPLPVMAAASQVLKLPKLLDIPETDSALYKALKS